jgi:hypothetical protein
VAGGLNQELVVSGYELSESALVIEAVTEMSSIKERSHLFCVKGYDMSKSETDARTDGICKTAGIYRSDCTDQERVTLAAGDHYPKGPSCRCAVGWNLIAAA